MLRTLAVAGLGAALGATAYALYQHYRMSAQNAVIDTHLERSEREFYDSMKPERRKQVDLRMAEIEALSKGGPEWWEM